MAHEYIVDTVVLGKKGQITLPKKIRDEDGMHEDDRFTVTHMPSGDIILRPSRIESPEDRMLQLLSKVKPFDWRKAWREVREERQRDR